VNKKILGIIPVIIIIITIIGISLNQNDSPPVVTQKTNEKIGLVINSPSQSVSLQKT